jgi:hypothetical protein
MTEFISILAPIFAALLGFLLGQYAERRKQSVAIRSEMLMPIEEWLSGAEKFNGILGDTLSSVVVNNPFPVIYDLEERRKITQFMIERSNVVFGILQSNSLKTWNTKRSARKLTEIVTLIDQILKTQLLPLDHEIHERSRTNELTQEFITRVGQVSMGFGGLIQTAYSLISRIRTSLI